MSSPTSGAPRVKTRASCDRCHRHKLRCPRDKDGFSCYRCVRLDVLCKYSPRNVRSARKLSQPTARNTLSQPQPITPSLVMNPSSSELISLDHERESRRRNEVYQQNQASDLIDAVRVIENQATTILPTTPGIFNAQYASWTDFSDGGQLAQEDTIPMVWDVQDFAINLPTLEPTAWPMKMSSNLSSPQEEASSWPAQMNRNLANLSCKILDCAATLPSSRGELRTSSTNHQPRSIETEAANTSTATSSSRSQRLFIFDHLFQFTKDFTDLITAYGSSLEEEEEEEDEIWNPHTSGFVTLSAPPNTFGSLNQLFPPSSVCMYTDQLGASQISPRIEDATTYMLMSCHTRLVDAYYSVFHMMKNCLEHSLLPSTDPNWAMVLPKLQMGPIALSPLRVDATSPVSSRNTSLMYMITFTVIMSQLWTRLVDIITRIVSSRDYGQGLGSSLGFAIWKAMLQRSNQLVQSLEEIKSLL